MIISKILGHLRSDSFNHALALLSRILPGGLDLTSVPQQALTLEGEFERDGVLTRPYTLEGLAPVPIFLCRLFKSRTALLKYSSGLRRGAVSGRAPCAGLPTGRGEGRRWAR